MGETCCDEDLGSELVFRTPQRPILCTGFEGSVAAKGSPVHPFFEWNKAGSAPLLSPEDESTTTPGLYLAGPGVVHEDLSFCFVYKFRQRFGIVADAISRGLGRNTAASVKHCRDTNMFLDDLSCCKEACGESC